jgi:DNA-binding transcriptional LysR family regulator
MKRPDRNLALTPEALELVALIARCGSFASAAREVGKVPSALTYAVRQLELSLDVLLFDRSARTARLTAAGEELLSESRRILAQLDTIANRVRRVATGWEVELAIAVDEIVESAVVLELMDSFYRLQTHPFETPGAGGGAPPTRMRLYSEVLNGTWEALLSGKVDLAIGLTRNHVPLEDIEVRPLGALSMSLAVAPHHALAALPGPVGEDDIGRHRIVVIGDTAARMPRLTLGVQPGQEVMTVPDLRTKVRAQVLGLGCGRLPLRLVRALQASGKLVGVAGIEPTAVDLVYAWRRSAARGKALAWWLRQLESRHTCEALLMHRADGS